jgi:nicotinamide-nucleotide adenylyltransferase
METKCAEQTALGTAHGRFQILHNEHLQYLIEAKRRCRHLIVGVTAFDTSLTQNAEFGGHRLRPIDNPLTYYERTLLIRAALLGEGISVTDFTITPFPIENPDHLRNYIPKNAVCYTTIREEWNKAKIRILREQGYDVEVVIEGAKGIASTDLRMMIMVGNDSWKHLVPASTVSLIEQFDLCKGCRRDSR